jgi:hypothetical protein
MFWSYDHLQAEYIYIYRYCWDEAQFQWPFYQCDTSIGFQWRGWRYREIECGVTSRRSVQLRLTCPDVLVGCVVDAPLIWCPQNGPSGHCRPCRTHSGSCIHLGSLVLSCLWPAGEEWKFTCEAGLPTWCCVGPVLCLFCWIWVQQKAGRRLNWAYYPVFWYLDDGSGHCESASLCNSSSETSV